MRWLAHWWGLLTNSAHKSERIELLQTLRDEDQACGREVAAQHLNSLIRKYDRRKGAANGTQRH